MSSRKRNNPVKGNDTSDTKEPPQKSTKIAGKPDSSDDDEIVNPVQHTYLECNTKFYDITANGRTLTTIWGKIGTLGTKLEHLAQKASTTLTMNDKIKEKVRKGYVEVPKPDVVFPPVTHEVKLLKRDPEYAPDFNFYDKWLTLTQRGKLVFARDGFNINTFTTTCKTFKSEDAAKKALDKAAADAISKGYIVTD